MNRRIEKQLTRSPDVLSASVPILAVETEAEKIEVYVEGDAWRCEDGRLGKSEE